MIPFAFVRHLETEDSAFHAIAEPKLPTEPFGPCHGSNPSDRGNLLLASLTSAADFANGPRFIVAKVEGCKGHEQRPLDASSGNDAREAFSGLGG